MKHLTTPSKPPESASLSVLVLIRHWPLSNIYQQQLLVLSRLKGLHELILVGKQKHGLPAELEQEPKIRFFQLNSASPALMAEAAAFEANADVLVILKQGVSLPAQMLQTIPLAIAQGYEFGGLLTGSRRWWTGLLKLATIHCKGLFWFRLSQGYFVSQKVFHNSGGFKYNGRLISFFELLCKQQKLARYTFLF